jgi:molybdopterin converting factor small subunit
MNKIKVLYFASSRRGNAEEIFECQKGDSLKKLLGFISEKYDLHEVLSKSLIAVNGNYVSKEKCILIDGDEVAIIPPVSGG